MRDYLVTYEYLLRRYIGLDGRALERLPMREGVLLLNRYHEDERWKTIRHEIFTIRVHGGDPLAIPYYRQYVNKSSRPRKKASITPAEAKTYRGLFDKALKDHRKWLKGKNSKSR